jgi:hypothetical protein
MTDPLTPRQIDALLPADRPISGAVSEQEHARFRLEEAAHAYAAALDVTSAAMARKAARFRRLAAVFRGDAPSRERPASDDDATARTSG